MIAWTGMIVGALFSLPMGVLAARNLTPLPIFGLGPLAGALALGVTSTGTLSKLISEAIEAVDEGPLESASAAGAHKPQQVRSQHPRLSDPRCPGRR